MSFVDRWCGIPICFCLGVFNRIFGSFKKPRNAKPKKILFIKLSEMGSIILSYPLIKKVKDTYPEAGIFFLTFQRNKPIFKILNIIPESNIISIRENTIFTVVSDAIRAILRFRKEKIDMVLDLEFFARCTAIISYLTGADKRIGVDKYNMEGLYRGNLLTHKVCYNPLLHITKSFFTLWQVAEFQKKLSPDIDQRVIDEEIALPIFSPPEGIADMMKRLNLSDISENSRVILIHPGEGNLPIREWPLENFISLTKLLLDNENNYVLLIGSKGTLKKANILCDTIKNKRCINIVGKTSLEDIFSLFYTSKALIANDCGISHLASLTPLRKFIFFGPESPHIFGPRDNNSSIMYTDLPCSPCLSLFNHRKTDCSDAKCLKTISPQYVYNLVKDQLLVYQKLDFTSQT